MDFANYDRWESGDPPCKDGTDSCWTMVEFSISSAVGTQLIETKVGTAQTPPVPWQLLWVLDWGWFILLGMTVIFLPDSPPLKVRRESPRAPFAARKAHPRACCHVWVAIWSHGTDQAGWNPGTTKC